MTGRHREPDPRTPGAGDRRGPGAENSRWQPDGEHTGPVAMPPGDPATAPQPVQQSWTAGPAAAPGPQQAAPPAYGGYPAPGGPSRAPRSAFAPQRAPGGPGPQGRAHPGPAAPLLRPGSRPPQQEPQRPRQGERKDSVAFTLHQFPIGYLPIAAATAYTQLPVPARDPRGCPPLDHPRSDLVGDADVLARVRAGEMEPEDSPGVAPPAEFSAGHDPLAGLAELEWEREYLESGSAERDPAYRWPPPESVPEAEPVVLDPDTVIDALGDGEGRIAAPDGTPFTERALPPAHLELPYHRYRVLRPLPVWRSIAVPWFRARGGGVRYRTTHPLLDLVAAGLLAELTPDRMVAEAGTIRLDRAEVERADHAGEDGPQAGSGTAVPAEEGTARLRTEPGRHSRPNPQATEESAQ